MYEFNPRKNNHQIMAQRRCRLCRQAGHTINRCSSPRMNEIYQEFVNQFNAMQTHEVLFGYLDSLPEVEVAVLALHNRLKTSLSNSELVETLTRVLTRKQPSKRILWSNYIADLRRRYPDLTLIEIFKKKFIDRCRMLIQRNEGYTSSDIVAQIYDYITDISNTQPIDIRDDIIQGVVDAVVYITENPGFADIQRKWSVGFKIAPTTAVEEECPICFESCDSETLIRTNCNHHFCYPCISRHLDTFKNKEIPHCAMCRGQIHSILLFSESHTEEFNQKYARVEV